ncbi:MULTISPECIES: phenylalanine--tRNA ligase subunit beta [Methanobacterium]|jgi:phenylalanyl-tRNA synthetase beta chain|uniref:Phenylalanine--tRNA ligase beta subunit n=1 Tax=Methanobacterium subterraneum TaxID=59277 RepID=A0A2H4VPF3_9EURY|nr:MULTISPECIES: phenylalanine--tRNA ligase subunit beta [Methanobacterium]AUB58976.1 phenylalanine--tRNA ligase subunit beta [Methanobacterium sp. MZ-A1]AUB59978.1 phenylalanine--tRNA ligase subunit beta [Methanobacterium subterraneum]MBW4257681.1 phenylalanine--tRNA ligase subunit beta [Methanobacterium sp. YSL]NMO08699.1 phenylalanine--tRNA ligase subunit beta [Methanobacterium subterraneum]
MPVIKFTYTDLEELLEMEIDKDELIDLLPMIGSDIEEYDDEGVKVEFFPNRPDYLSVEGVARALKGFLKIEEGIPKYPLEPSGTSITIDPGLKNIRPYTACCLVLNVEFDDDKLPQIMDFQEDLHWVIGRDRKKVAIGIHNLDVIKGPFRYFAADPDEVSFVPLESDEEMTLREILTQHKKGQAYAHLIDQYDRYPLIMDSEDKILSMPPIINGELTKLTSDTRNLFVDVTGTDQQAVERTLNIIATSFAESGATIQTMENIYPDETFIRPDLTPKERTLSLKNAVKLIGIPLTLDMVVESLRKVRFDAEVADEDTVLVKIPPYRADILHEVDIIENVAIGYCFRKIEPELPQVATVAREDPYLEFDQNVREIMNGLSFTEVMSLMLTNEENHFQKMKLQETERVEVAQPISQDRTMIRQSLLNGLLEFLEDNKHEELPQRIFEVGETVFLDGENETRTKGSKKMAAMITHSQANFTEIKSTSDAFINNLGLEMVIDDLDHPSFIRGRCALLKGVKKETGEICVEGFFGEMNPEVIRNFELEYPVVAMEVEFKTLK